MILDNFVQWLREYTLHRDDPASQPKGWIQGNMRIVPVLEWKSRPVFNTANMGLNFESRHTSNMELKFESSP